MAVRGTLAWPGKLLLVTDHVTAPCGRATDWRCAATDTHVLFLSGTSNSLKGKNTLLNNYNNYGLALNVNAK